MGRVFWRSDREAYYLDYTDADGIRHKTRASKDKRVAQEILRSKETEVDRIKAGLQDRVGQEMPLEDLKTRYLRQVKETRSPKTYYLHELSLKGVLADLKVRAVRDLSPETILNVIEACRARKLSNRTINIRVGVLRTMINWAIRSRIIGSNPLLGLRLLSETEKKRRRRALTEGEIGKLLDASSPERALIWRTFLYTGLRKSELVHLTWADVNLERGEITVRAENAKTKKARTIPLRSGLAAALKRRKEQQPGCKDGSLVFPSETGIALDSRNLLRDFQGTVKRAGINETGVDIHALRYTFCTHLCKAGVNIKTAQVLMGHSDIRLTMDIYTDPTLLDKRGAVEALPDFARTPEAERQVARATGTDGEAQTPAAEAPATSVSTQSCPQYDPGELALVPKESAGEPNSSKVKVLRGRAGGIRTHDLLHPNPTPAPGTPLCGTPQETASASSILPRGKETPQPGDCAAMPGTAPKEAENVPSSAPAGLPAELATLIETWRFLPLDTRYAILHLASNAQASKPETIQ